MRTLRDRIRHMIMFELLLVVICTPLLSFILQREMSQVGGLTLGLSLAAMLSNLAYNYYFDRLLLALHRPLYPRSLGLRVMHSVVFELILLVVLVPIIMVWMGYGFLQAVALELGFAVLVPVYALGFNWGYDLVFPAPAVREP